MMSVGIAWPESQGVLPLPVCSGVDEDLRLCSDSDSQLELTELIESITCDDATVSEGGTVVAGIMETLLNRVEEVASASSRRSAEILDVDAREIDVDRSRDKKSRHHDPDSDTPRKVRRKRDHDKKKLRGRSTSCSTTSSACSGSDASRKHRRKHKHHRRKEEDPSPRVNPIFLWVKQDDTRIVEVLCEDYDKRNRIRLTKTAHGWRATPRTERLDSTLSRSSLDLSPSPPPIVECPPSLVSPPQTKEKKTTKRCVSRKNKRCDRKKDKGFKNVNFVDEYKNVDVVNNNYCNVSNNNKDENSLVTESSLSDPSFRSFGYKKACHKNTRVCKKKKDNKRIEDIDIYTFVDTPKTDSDAMEEESESEGKTLQEDVVRVKEEIETQESDSEMNSGDLESTLDFTACENTPDVKLEPVFSEPEVSEPDISLQMEKLSNTTENNIVTKTESPERIDDTEKTVPVECKEESNNIEEKNQHESQTTEDKLENPQTTEEKLGTPQTTEEKLETSQTIEEKLETPQTIEEKLETPQTTGEKLETPQTTGEKLESPQTTVNNNSDPESNKGVLEQSKVQNSETEIPIEDQSEENILLKQSTPEEKDEKIEIFTDEVNLTESHSVENVPIVESSTIGNKEENNSQQSAEDLEEEDVEEDPLPEIILPEPHLQTPEPSPQPVPETSSIEPESSMADIPLQPDTSLDSDTIHLPDTTTKSDSSSLISTDISLGQTLSIPKPQTELSLIRPSNREPTLLGDQLHSVVKPVEHSHLSQSSRSELKTAEMLRQEEIERQITADLDEDHLLAIEEILQGEECVEDLYDDLPEEYSGSHESSPVNLVLDLKSKDQVDNRGIPLSLRTDDFLEMFPTPPPMKEQSEPTPTVAILKKTEVKVEKTIPHAHQQSKTKFLESILSCPKRCHKGNEKTDSSDQQEPLYLGVSRKSASPTVSSSDGRKFSSPELEPKPKRMKVEDITLKTILNRNKEPYPKAKASKPKDNEETQQTADSTTKSRLLELLTNENDEHISKMDPLTQLKEVLSDPDLNVPDPLLVPRARLPALVANPAKEIPRLLAMKSENMSYPKLLTDPDLLVVSLSHLQSLLQAAGKEEEILKYQQQAQLLQQQMKQEQATLDAATATALNQMMWLPYLSQLEAAAMACGNTQDFMTMLNMVFPSGTYPQMNPYMMPTPTSPGINAYDYKSQLEFQQAFALWNEAMMQAATNQFAAQSLASTNTNNISKLYQNYQDTKYNSKSHSTPASKHQDSKHTSARTSPISHNYQQNKYRTSSQYPYTSMFSIPTSTPTTSLPSGSSQYKTTTVQSQSYPTSRQRGYHYSNYSSLTPSISKTESSTTSSLSASDLFSRSHQKLHSNSSSSSNNNSTKSIMNFLSKPKQSETKSHINKAYPTSTTMLPKETTLRMTSHSAKMIPEPPKLKVKQPQHLVDPNSRPKLLNFDEHGEVGSTTGSLTPQVDETHPNLWHPLFSSHQQKSYSSPWQWTTPVTVSGE